MPSYEHFEDFYQVEVKFESSELITAQTLFGAGAELNKAFSDINYKKINEFMLEYGGQWIIQWKRNPHTISNMGRLWERQKRSVRSILVALLKIYGSMNDESLGTLLAEVEAIVNARPIPSESLSDVYSPVLLCPVQLLTMKSVVVMPPPG